MVDGWKPKMENKAGSWRGRVASNKCKVSFVFREQIRFFLRVSVFLALVQISKEFFFVFHPSI